jgi:hypothetical protein
MSVGEEYLPDERIIDLDPIFDDDLLYFFHELIFFLPFLDQFIYHIYHILKRKLLGGILYCSDDLGISFFELKTILTVLVLTTKLSYPC